MSRYKELLDQYTLLDKEYEISLAKYMELSYQYQELRESYKEQADQSEEIKRLHENARRLKHDMKNHILVIASYLNGNEIESAKEYLSRILDKLNQMYTYIETGNSVLNFCINQKLQLAHEHGIEIKAEVENLPFSGLESVDLTAILSNLLDNAIEAEKTMEFGMLSISINRKRGYDTILVKNRIIKSVLQENPELNTTKTEKDSHGYGLRQIKDMVRKYDGMLDIYEEDGMFCVSIAFHP